jgi:hypothetical protein
VGRIIRVQNGREESGMGEAALGGWVQKNEISEKVGSLFSLNQYLQVCHA